MVSDVARLESVNAAWDYAAANPERNHYA